jgi:hypothetical protein
LVDLGCMNAEWEVGRDEENDVIYGQNANNNNVAFDGSVHSPLRILAKL